MSSASSTGRAAGAVLVALLALLAGPVAADYAAAKALYDAERYAEAAAAFEAAAKQGEALAQFMMGRIHQDGTGADRDAVRAYAWYSIAASSGYYPAVAAREALSPALGATQLAQAQQMAADWRLAHPLARGASPQPGSAPEAAAWPRGQEDGEPYSIGAVQRLLNELGYRAGPVDGVAGPRTKSAIRAFEIDGGLPPTEEASPALHSSLLAARRARLGLSAAPQDAD